MPMLVIRVPTKPQPKFLRTFKEKMLSRLHIMATKRTNRNYCTTSFLNILFRGHLVMVYSLKKKGTKQRNTSIPYKHSPMSRCF